MRLYRHRSRGRRRGADACRRHVLPARALRGPARRSVDAEAIDALGRIIEALDPAAAIAFDLACPTCGDRWSAPLDVAAALWAEIKRAAESLLLEIDTLARAYSWSEAAILRLSPLRRAAYLQLAEAS